MLVDSLVRLALVVAAGLLLACGAARGPVATSTTPAPLVWWWQNTFVDGTPAPAALPDTNGGVLAVGMTLQGNPAGSSAGTLCAARLVPTDGTLLASHCLGAVQALDAPILLSRVADRILVVQGNTAWSLDATALDVRWQVSLVDSAVAALADGNSLVVVGQSGELQILAIPTGAPVAPTSSAASIHGLLGTTSGRAWAWSLEEDAWGRPLLAVGPLDEGAFRPQWRAPVNTSDRDELRQALTSTAGWLASDVFVEPGVRALASGSLASGECPHEVAQAAGPLRWSTEQVRGHLLQMQRLTVCPPSGAAWTTILPVGFPIQSVTLTTDGAFVAAATQRGWALLEPGTGVLVDWLRLPQADTADATSRVDRDASLCSIVALHADWGVLQCILWNGVAYEAVPREQEPTQPAGLAQRRVR